MKPTENNSSTRKRSSRASIALRAKAYEPRFEGTRVTARESTWHALVISLFVLAGVLLGISTGTSAAERHGVVVIANESLRISSIDEAEIRRLFLGKSRTLPNGERAALASYGPSASFFNDRVLAQSDARVAATWSRLRFAGRTPPPRIFDSLDEIIAFVAATPNALAYVPSRAALRDGVRVFYNVPL